MYYYESKGQWGTHILATGWRGRQREERPSPERRHISYFFFVEKTCSIMKRNQNKKRRFNYEESNHFGGNWT